jgi:hypothetical protein
MSISGLRSFFRKLILAVASLSLFIVGMNYWGPLAFLTVIALGVYWTVSFGREFRRHPEISWREMLTPVFVPTRYNERASERLGFLIYSLSGAAILALGVTLLVGLLL